MLQPVQQLCPAEWNMIDEIAWDAYLDAWSHYRPSDGLDQYITSYAQMNGFIIPPDLRDIVPDIQDIEHEVFPHLYMLFKDEVYESSLRDGWWSEYESDIEMYSDNFWESWYGFVDELINERFDETDVLGGIVRWIRTHQVFVTMSGHAVNVPVQGVW